MPYRLLDAFEQTLRNGPYRHRNSTHGDRVAGHLYEDLYELSKSSKYRQRVDKPSRVLNTANKRRGIKARRGDGTFGELVPNTKTIDVPGFHVARGQIATIEIGIEAKFLAKAMIKQIDRVMNDLRGQVESFRQGGGTPICLGLIGINFADHYVGYEKDRTYPTTGTGSYRHPIQEAPEAERRILATLTPVFDELILLKFKATNEEPYPFEWLDAQAQEQDYGAALVRISREYDHRF